jgi:RNAse (barnase) inhibitor barstar
VSTFDVPAEFLRVVDPREYAAAARKEGKLVVWIPSTVRSKEKLLAVLSQGLRFTNYFGWNWDALEECLHDLSWLPENAQIAIVHEAMPFGAGENRQIYCDILRAAVQPRGGRTIEVVLS